MNPPALHQNHEDAFSRHRGLLTVEDQHVLKRSRVAMGGMGGAGGIYLAALSPLERIRRALRSASFWLTAART